MIINVVRKYITQGSVTRIF